MAGVVAGLLTSAVVKIAGDKLSTALAEQGNLAWNFSDDLEDMKDTMESVVAVLKDAEQQSIKKESVRLWLKRLKDAALDISDMMGDYQDCHTQRTEKISGEHVTRYTMHDLVHDLATSVIGDELTVIDCAKTSNVMELKYCRYALLTNCDGQTKLSNILPKKVRALHFSRSSKVGPCVGFFSFTKCLRILDFSGCSGILFPSRVDQLKQLRCLIAPKMQNERLPDSIAELPKLQYLNLYGSSLISALPESTSKLGCLAYHSLSGCSGILKVPQSFGGLKSLMHLYMSGCSLLKELPGSLGNLTNLQHLDLSNCTNVEAIPESLCCLIQLQYLNLSSCERIERIPGSIGSLTDLQYLDMSGCLRIKELPESFANLGNLLHLSLYHCTIEKGLRQALHGLTALEHLNLNLHILKCGDPQEYGDLHDALENMTNLKYLDLSFSADIFFGHSDRCIGTLTNLECLKVCGSDLVYLPESIGNLKKLHTLDLSYCYRLKYLPHSISEITTLKSLLIEGCSDELIEQLTSRLHYSLTLPLFKVRADDVSACSNLPLLEDANVHELRIFCLENVRFPEEAHKVKLLDKNKLRTLTLAWSLDADRFLNDDDSLGQLVPPRGLKRLFLEGYSSQSFPGWLMGIYHHLPNLVRIDLDTLPRCNNLPPLGQLPSLEGLTLRKCPSIRKVDKDFCGGKGAFPRLSRFSLFCMDGLEEWSTAYSVKDGEMEEFMFPMLDRLCVEDCPSLRLKPCPPKFHECAIENSDQVICSLEEVGNNIAHLTFAIQSTTLMIKNSSCQSMDLFNQFPTLQELLICDCPNLTSLPESMRLLVSLQLLHLKKCDSISALPQWLGDLSSLRSLTIKYCTRVKSLPPCIQQLTKLQALRIKGNPELKQWCVSEENKKKLTHIYKIDFDFYD